MERLQKIIAQNSEFSRRAAEQLILDGKVKVDGQVITELGTKVSENTDIEVQGQKLISFEKVYYLLNKPVQTISSRTDDRGRMTVVELINDPFKIYPVGRLDYNTTGALLLTNDGTLANGLMHPNHQIPKTYIAKVKGKIPKKDILSLAKGIEIDGRKTLPCTVKIVKFNALTNTGIIQLDIVEGRNHQVKKMFEAIGGYVVKLQRTNYAFLDVKNLSHGEYRSLKLKEVQKLYGLIK